ncbi:Fatty acid synthesis protein, partial [Paramaledivibacter caminithermalis DSM 15212]
KDTKKADNEAQKVTAPPKEVVTGQISGIDIMDLEDAVKALWKEKIYAESGMGCTGPIVLVNEEKLSTATEILSKAGFVAKAGSDC